MDFPYRESNDHPNKGNAMTTTTRAFFTIGVDTSDSLNPHPYLDSMQVVEWNEVVGDAFDMEVMLEGEGDFDSFIHDHFPEMQEPLWAIHMMKMRARFQSGDPSLYGIKMPEGVGPDDVSRDFMDSLLFKTKTKKELKSFLEEAKV